MHDDALAVIRRDKNRLAAELLTAGAQFRGDSVKCPFHDDRHASGSIYENDSGEWRFKCHACNFGGSIVDIRSKRIGTPVEQVIRDLVGGGNGKTKPPSQAPKSKPGPINKKDEGFSSLEELASKVHGQIEGRYLYKNPETGNADLIVFRHRPDPNESKKFLQANCKDGRYYFGGGKKPLPIYNRAAVELAKCVVVVEGEKCCHAIEDLGAMALFIAATTSPGGANGAANADWSPLAGKDIVIWPDNDENGAKYADDVFQILNGLSNPPKRIKQINPNELGIPPKGDIVEFLQDLPEDQKQTIFFDAIDSAPVRSVASGLEERLHDVIAGRWATVQFVNWPRLGWVTNCLLPGTVTLLCGDPGATKSLFLLEALSAWHDQELKTAVYQLEENVTYHLQRVLAQRTGNSKFFNTDWMQKNADEVLQNFRRYESFLGDFGKTITVAGEKRPTMNDLCDWVEERAKAGCRIIGVDPISVAKKSKESWLDDDAFMARVLPVVEKYGVSLILITHPIKGRKNSRGGLSDLSGGAAYERVAQTVLWIETHNPPKEVMIKGELGNRSTEVNRIISVYKARNGKGGGYKIGYNFSGDTLTTKEEGGIVKE